MKAVVFGSKGELALAVAEEFANYDFSVEMVSRYDVTPDEPVDVYVFPQGTFLSGPLAAAWYTDISNAIDVGLTSIVLRLHECLAIEASPDKRIDYVLIGSTSSYQGFANSAVYCAVKHGLLGLVRALNDEYASTNRRFWLFSMGTMNTAMGRQLTDQDESTFLSVHEVAQRIVGTITNPSNMFESEIIIRRRTVR